MKHIDKFIKEYMKTNNLENINTIESIPDKIDFFNKFTKIIFGEPLYIDNNISKSPSTSSIQYCFYKPVLKNDITEYSINMLYPYIIANSNIEFNFENFNKKLLEFIHYRYKCSKDIKNVIEIYINMIFGMINNPKSILRSTDDKIRTNIVKEANKILIYIMKKLVENNITIYYIDTNSFIIETVDISKIKYIIKESINIIDEDIDIKYIESMVILGIKNYIKYDCDPIEYKGKLNINNNIIKKDNKIFIKKNKV